MKRHVAFLRAVNVGNRTLKGQQIVSALRKLPLRNLQTFLASGNVIFDFRARLSKKLRVDIEKQLEEESGFAIDVFLRSLGRLEEIVRSNPFNLTAIQRQQFTISVFFLNQPIANSIQSELKGLRTDYDDLACLGEEVWWLCRGKKTSDSTLFRNNRLAKVMSVPCTARNLRTLERMVERYGDQ